ncbi:MAG: hypothetical protein R3310_05610 [Candidatus Competibacteraceae bacterium]|nr:hypothetical protein [Candidatus Competibacteraceae bacterium]
MAYGVNVSVRQGELDELLRTHRIGKVVVYRVERSQLGGGFGDQDKYPYAWTVVIYIDGLPASVMSARGLRREWTSLDRLERWLREQGIRYWSVTNELEPLGQSAEPPAYPSVPPSFK